MNEEQKKNLFQAYVLEVESEGLGLKERLHESKGLPELVLTPKDLRQAINREAKFNTMNVAEKELARVRQKEKRRQRKREERSDIQTSAPEPSPSGVPPLQSPVPTQRPGPGEGGGNRRQRREGLGRSEMPYNDSPSIMNASLAVGVALAGPVSGIEMALTGLCLANEQSK